MTTSLLPMLVLNSISLFYHNLSSDTWDTSDKPAGVIEDWTKAVVHRVTKSATGNGRLATRPSATRPSATLVSKKSKKAAEADARLSAYWASDDEHIRIKKEESEEHEVVKGSVKWNNNDLPPGCNDNLEWRRVFVPTYLTFLAARPDPWTIEDDAACQGLQKIWNTVYHNRPGKPDHFHMVLSQRAVFGVALQRVCEWRGGFGSTALAFLNAFFATNKGYETDELRKEFAQDKLRNFKFLYEYTTGEDRKVRFISVTQARNDDCPNRIIGDCSLAPLFYRHLPIISTP